MDLYYVNYEWGRTDGIVRRRELDLETFEGSFSKVEEYGIDSYRDEELHIVYYTSEEDLKIGEQDSLDLPIVEAKSFTSGKQQSLSSECPYCKEIHQTWGEVFLVNNSSGTLSLPALGQQFCEKYMRYYDVIIECETDCESDLAE